LHACDCDLINIVISDEDNDNISRYLDIAMTSQSPGRTFFQLAMAEKLQFCG